MKKLVLTVLAATTWAAGHAQVIIDTVATGAGYANQVWYSLPDDEKGTAPKNNWDLAFDASGFGSTILINSVTGTTLWAYPSNDTAGWSTVDTNGLSTWTARYNSDTSWAYGAMGRYADATDPYDLDWGIYNVTTHIITGDSIYIIKLSTGDFKKLWIQSLSGGIYSFKYANIDGTSPYTATFDKSLYGGKNFGYYSLQTNAPLDREPVSVDWDLVFTQYTTFIPQAYTVTGVLGNAGVEIARCANVIGKDTFVNWSAQAFATEINTIGYNWKTFTGTGYAIQDSLVFFVARRNGEIWKMIFKGFAGSASGANIFSKEKLFTPSGINETYASLAGMAIYPNPATGHTVNVVYNLSAAVNTALLSICDITGRQVYAGTIEHTTGLHQHVVPVGDLTPGMYLVTVSAGHETMQQKLIIR